MVSKDLKKICLKQLKLIIFIFSTLLLTQQNFRYIYLMFIFVGSIIKNNQIKYKFSHLGENKVFNTLFLKYKIIISRNLITTNINKNDVWDLDRRRREKFD